MRLLITGASGGIGAHLCRAFDGDHEILRVSRREAADGRLVPCDLTQEPPKFAEAEPAPVDWIVHLATSYRVQDDLAMLDNLLAFARQHHVRNFLYVSSWVVHFPRRPIGAGYIEMKRQCERRLLESGLENVRIVRPSVVLGEGLSWSRTLARLGIVAPLIPRTVSRSFVHVEEVVQVVRAMIEDRTGVQIVTALGTRSSLAAKAREQAGSSSWPLGIGVVLCVALVFAMSPVGQWLGILLGLAILAALLWVGRWLLVHCLAGLSDYFAGFVVTRFEPSQEADVLALCHASNANVQIRGYDNARLYFQNPNSPVHTTVGLRRFDEILKVDAEQKTADVQAGIHFGELLPRLEAQGLWLDNYPNYHFISVGACIATAVHGSNLTHPFLADLLESVRYYDRERDQVMELDGSSDELRSLVFDRNSLGKKVILTARLRVCDRQYYHLTTRREPVESLRFDHIDDFIGGQAQHYEVRINTPDAKQALLQSYRQLAEAEEGSADRVLSIKADAIGRKWNLFQKNGFCSAVSSTASRMFINYEWFFSPDAFADFWREISADRKRYRLYKLLIRYNREGSSLKTPYHGTVSIDVTIWNTSTMKNRSVELYEKYRPLEHLGKYSIERYIEAQR